MPVPVCCSHVPNFCSQSAFMGTKCVPFQFLTSLLFRNTPVNPLRPVKGNTFLLPAGIPAADARHDGGNLPTVHAFQVRPLLPEAFTPYLHVGNTHPAHGAF